MDFVIDTSLLRKAELETALQNAATSDRFILADTAVLETMKTAQWESTARRSFAIISRFPDLISTATEPSMLMKAELNSGSDTTEVVDVGLTRNFRVLLAEIATGNDGRAMKHIRNEILATQVVLAKQQQNYRRNLRELKVARGRVKAAVNLKAYRRLLTDELRRRQFRLRFAKAVALRSIRMTSISEGKGPEIGDALAHGRGIILRHAIGYNLLGFKWAILNGLESYPAKKATNEMMDLNHAVIGTFCNGILSDEDSVVQMRQDILDALDLDPLQFPGEQPPSDSETSASPISTF